MNNIFEKIQGNRKFETLALKNIPVLLVKTFFQKAVETIFFF